METKVSERDAKSEGAEDAGHYVISRVGKREGVGMTLGLARGFSCSSFFAAASMAAAAPRSSFSAMTVGSSGSTHSVPGGMKGGRKGLSQSRWSVAQGNMVSTTLVPVETSGRGQLRTV